MFKTIINAIKTPDVRKRVLYTLLLIVVFRMGCYITVPGVDVLALGEQMKNATGTLVGLIDTLLTYQFSQCQLLHTSLHQLLFNFLV